MGLYEKVSSTKYTIKRSRGGEILNFVQPIRDPDKIQEIKDILKKHNERNYILFVLGINIGLRVSDLVRIKVGDVKNKEHLIITEKKTGKSKRILITPQLKKDLKDYIKYKPDDEYIIKSRQGLNKPLSRFMVYRILKDTAKKCCLDEIGTHTLRKTFGYHFYREHKNVALLMELFNHSSERITLRYIGINQDVLDKAMENFKI